MSIKRPETVEVFGSDAMQGNYLPVKFGTNIVIPKGDFSAIANQNYKYGLEALEEDLQMKDLNSVFFYQGSLIKYLFERGLPEFSAYEDYPSGAVVQKDGVVWVATKEVKASVHKQEQDSCGCCVQECPNPQYPSKESGWCKLITSCEYDQQVKDLLAKDEALEKAIQNLKGVEGLAIVPNKDTGAIEFNLTLSDGSSIVIPMTKFGHINQKADGSLEITNADGSKLELPKYVAEKDLDQQKGFFFNAQSDKWEVDLADLVKDGSGLQVDKNGNISVKMSDLVDGKTLNVNSVTGKLELDPMFYRTNIEEPLKDLKDVQIPRIDKLESALNKEAKKLNEDLVKRINEVNNNLNKLKDLEVALNTAKSQDNFKRITDLENQIFDLKGLTGSSQASLDSAIKDLASKGLTPEELSKAVSEAVAKAIGTGKYITRIQPNTDGSVTYYYSDGSTAKGELVGVSVASDEKTLTGNGRDKVLQIKLSKQAGNLLQSKDDGLYYGTRAVYPALFIDYANGSDDNIGSRQFPLKTLKEAVNRNPSGVNVNIYFKEDTDHIIDNTTGTVHLKAGKYVFYPYGEYFDNLPKTEPNAVDGFSQGYYLVRNKKAPRIIFKNLWESRHPNNGSSAPQLNVYGTVGIQVSSNTSLQLQGLHFISDLNFELTLVNNKVRNSINCIIYPTRMYLENGSDLSVTNCSFETRGKPIVNIPSEEDKIWFNENALRKQRAYLEPDEKGLYLISFFSDYLTTGATMGVRNINIVSYEMKQYLYGCEGWNTLPKVTSSLSSVNKNENNWIAKHMYGTTLDDESKTVIAPKTDILYKHFKG